jgi:hypothetical protein
MTIADARRNNPSRRHGMVVSMGVRGADPMEKASYLILIMTIKAPSGFQELTPAVRPRAAGI